MRIVTRCKSPEQFVAVFHRFCDGRTCFIPTTDTRPVGSTLSFSLRLADDTPMLLGTCIVKAAWETHENEFKRPGVQLELTELHPESEALFEFMLAQKTAVVSDGTVEPVTPVTTNKHVPRDKAIDLILRQVNAPIVTVHNKDAQPPGAPTPVEEDSTQRVDTNPPPSVVEDAATPTIQMPPLQYQTETRTPGSAIVLPANPLSDFDESALDDMLSCTLAEAPDADAPPSPPMPATRDVIATMLGIAPLERGNPAPLPVIKPAAVPVVPLTSARGVRAPIVLDARPPASRSLFRLHAMTAEERYWVMYALGGALLVAAIVLASAFVFAS